MKQRPKAKEKEYFLFPFVRERSYSVEHKKDAHNGDSSFLF